jgi:hypothetical protein
MNAKKGLKSRIRGWFPQEASIISTRLQVTHENKQPPLIIPPEYKVSVIKSAGAFAAFWIIFYGLIIFNSINLERYGISSFQIVAWIVAGLAVGLISGTMSTKTNLIGFQKNINPLQREKTSSCLLFH